MANDFESPFTPMVGKEPLRMAVSIANLGAREVGAS